MRLIKAVCTWALCTSKNGDFTNSLGILLSCLTAITEKTFSLQLISFLSRSLCLLVLPPSLCTSGNTMVCLLYVCLPIKQLRTALVSSHVFQPTVKSEKNIQVAILFSCGNCNMKVFCLKNPLSAEYSNYTKFFLLFLSKCRSVVN